MSSLRLLLLLCAAAVSPATALTLTTLNVAVTEDFDSLGTATGSAMPAGWEFLETGSGANGTYGASNGGSSTGNTFSFGATSAADRALGSLRTSSVSSVFGVMITNATGFSVSTLELQYSGEQWRLGATGRVDRLDFAYSLDATAVGNGSWIEVDALDFTAPVSAGATGALDGNAAENRLAVASSLSGLNLAPGATLWLRWSDFDTTGSEDGLAIDDVSVMTVKGFTPAVPDGLPMWAVVSVFAALVLVARRTRERVTRGSEHGAEKAA